MIPSAVKDAPCEHQRLILASKELVGFGPKLVIVPKLGETSMHHGILSSDSGYHAASNDCTKGNGGELVLTPTDDAYVSPRRKQLNHGNETVMIVDGRPGNVALIKFDASCLEGNLLKSAVLKVFAVDGSRNGGLFHVLTHDDESLWHESTVTWTNAPKSYNHGTQVEKVRTGTWTEVNITNNLVLGE